ADQPHRPHQPGPAQPGDSRCTAALSPRAPGEYEPEDGEHHGPRESGHGVVGLHESSVPPSRYGVRVRTLDQPAYPDDDGAVDPAVQAAVDEYARGGQFGDVLVALGTARIIVPVVAMPARTAPDPRAGSAGQKEGE